MLRMGSFAGRARPVVLRTSNPPHTADVVGEFDAWAARDLAGINAALRGKRLDPIVVLSRQQWEAAGAGR